MKQQNEIKRQSFGTLLRESMKSGDTEENIDIYFTRPIGLLFALLWNRLGIHPNAITVLSLFFGVGAGYMFYFTDLTHNLYGVALLMLANFCDSTDGQMARLSGKKTLVGRVLDGFSGDVWFFSIYVAICMRLQGETIPATDVRWGIWIWLMAAVAGLLCHSPQSSLADYYRQIHLFFLKGKEGSELDNYRQQRAIYDGLQKGEWFKRLFYYNYANYCRSQERRTPQFQKFFAMLKERFGGADQLPAKQRERFLDGSRPLMKYTNFLTFNMRAITLYIACLANCPWVYLLAEITVFSGVYIYMHKRHEALCEQCAQAINGRKNSGRKDNSRKDNDTKDIAANTKDSNRKDNETKDITAMKEEQYTLQMLPGVRGIIFDYGGTLDTEGRHWGKVLWHAYRREQMPVREEQFREAYVHGERTLAQNPIIKPDYTFRRTLETKIRLQMQYLCETGVWQIDEHELEERCETVLKDIYKKVRKTTYHSREVLIQLHKRFPMVLVSNFYGNINRVLLEFGLDGLFDSVIESAVVGVRKPDPRIFELGVEALKMKPEEIVVVGDSFDKDIVPAASIGCRTIWFKGAGWTQQTHDETLPNRIITDLNQLQDLNISLQNV